ncbi:unnamed protein product, partial [Musa acuminata var. zebrina]
HTDAPEGGVAGRADDGDGGRVRATVVVVKVEVEVGYLLFGFITAAPNGNSGQDDEGKEEKRREWR